MTSKILRSTFLAGVLVFLISAGTFLGILYGYFENRVFTELRSEAVYAARGVELSGAEYFDGLSSDSRITWVSPDGTVLFDSVGNADTMPNHADREEICEATELGEGQSSHYSDIFMEKTLYHAQLLSDGSVVRVSCTQNTVLTLILGMASPLFWVLAAVLIISALMAARLAKRIMAPINRLDPDKPELEDGCEELQPLVQKLREQKLTINSQLKELSRRQREFAAITENMAEGFVLIDNKSAVLSYNSAAREVLELNEESDPSAMLLGVDARFREAAAAALAGEHGEAILELGERSYELIANPVTANGQVTGAVLVIMDITEKRQREELRREFTANVSHELKTPLTSISGFAELIRDGLADSEKSREFAGDIYNESRRLLALIEDIIRLSQLDEESFSPPRESVELLELSRDVCRRLQGAASARDITLTAEGESASVSGVYRILDEMVYNLVDNAIKYNVEGGFVAVTVSREETGARLSVRDGGIGIAPDQQQRVFERFYRVEKSHSRALGGTGLGLSIVKHAAKYHDARIDLKSAPGEGTQITVSF